jgi:hypothetical protein
MIFMDLAAAGLQAAEAAPNGRYRVAAIAWLTIAL